MRLRQSKALFLLLLLVGLLYANRRARANGSAETDGIFPPEKRRQTEDILLGKDTPWQINLYSSVQHGFAVRADLSNPRAKWAKEQAFYQAVQWFDEYVKKE